MKILTDEDRAEYAVMRAEFEVAFGPMPKHCTWTGFGFSQTSFGAWEASSYAEKFIGFVAGCAARRAVTVLQEKLVAKCDLPDDVLAVLQKAALDKTLTKYVGEDELMELHPFSDKSSYVAVYSWNFPGASQGNLKRLLKLVKDGLLVEVTYSQRKGAPRSFTAVQHMLNEIGAEAISYWESLGYVVGQRMSKTEAHKQAERDAGTAKL